MKKHFTYKGRKIEYELERKRVKNLNLRIRRDGSIYVSVPYFTPMSSVEAFLHSRGEQLISAADRLRQNARAVAELSDSLVLCGRRVPIVSVPGGKNSARFTGEKLILTLKEPGDGEARERALKKLLRELAEERVSESCGRIYPLFAAMGVARPELRFRSMKSRWGSCNYERGILCFNTALAHVPQGCVDYVVVHEFCHFLRPDHSPDFHRLMTRLLPDWKERKKVLEKYSSLL